MATAGDASMATWKGVEELMGGRGAPGTAENEHEIHWLKTIDKRI